MPASGYFLVRVQELQRPEVIHSVKVRWYSSIKDLKDQLHLITHEPPSAQHIFHPSNPTEFRNSSTLQSIGIDHDGFTLKVAFDDYVRAPYYLEPLKKELIDEPAGVMLEEVRQGLKRDKAPKVTDELDGSGGVYFLRSQKGFYAAVFKPHDEEQGMPNNPKGYDGVGQTGLRDHFRPGQGCLREVAAYIMDHDNFCGVPPTALIHCQHSSFSYPTTSGKRKLFPKLGSLQQFVRASECFDDLGPGQFSDFEIQKIALLDLRLLNCDRNAANMLVRYKRSISGGSTSSEGNEHGNGSHSVDACSPSDSADRDGGSWIDRNSPVSGQDMYELVPIDHGYCMPSKLRIDEFDLTWMTLPQVKREVHPTIKEYVASLDFEAMLYNVLEQISLPGNSIFLLALAHLLVVQGIASGLTLYEIATLVARLDDEHASKLEQAIEEAEENAFRAIEMKSQRFPSNPSLLSAGHATHPQLKGNVPLSPLHYRNSKPGSAGSPQKEMDLVSPSNASSAHTIHASISMTDLLQEESKNTSLDPVACEKIRNNLAIGTDGVWDMKSIAACASPATSVMKSISPYVGSPQLINKDSPDTTAFPKSSVATTATFCLNMSKQLNGIQKPSPLELGSSFLSNLILAACEDDCEVAIGSPTRGSPHDTGVDAVNIPPKLVRSPLAKKEVDFQPPFGGYLAPIDEERRMRGGSTGSTCSSTDNGGNEPPPMPAIQTRDSMLSSTVEKADISSFVNRHTTDRDPLGPSLSRMPRYDDSGSSDVVYRSVQLNSVLPLPPGKGSLLSSPKFLSALSDMHEGQSMDGNVKGNDLMSTLPLQGTELSRMRSVGPPASAARMAEPQYNLGSTSKDSFGEQGSRCGSTFEGIGSGCEIDIEDEGKVETYPEANAANGEAAGTSGTTSPLSVSALSTGNGRNHVIEKASKDEKVDSTQGTQPEACATGSTSFCDLYSPLSKILAVPSDPNLSSSLLETCMTAGENAVEPIEQPRLCKLPAPEKEGRGSNTTTATTEISSMVSPKAPAHASLPNAESVDKAPLRKRKHGSFASDSEEPVVEGDVSRPYSTPSPGKRAAAVDAQLGPRSATQTSETKKAWHKVDLSAEKKSVEQDPDLYNVPGMTRVASFSGFESAPIYDFHAEGRFGSLRQEKRKTIMKTPEFNKFRLHFAHEAVLSIINRLLKQKELQKNDAVTVT